MAGPQFAKWIRSGVVSNFIDHLFTVHFIYCIEKTETKLGFICAYHLAAPGSNPKHTIYTFFNLYYWNCDEKRTKINKKRPGLAHFKKRMQMTDFYKMFHWFISAVLFYRKRKPSANEKCPKREFTNWRNLTSKNRQKWFTINYIFTADKNIFGG